MELSQLHELTLQVLKERYKRLREGQTPERQFLQDLNAGQIIDDVAFQAYELGLWKPAQQLHEEKPQFAGSVFPQDDQETVRSVLWQLVGLGILTPRKIHDERSQHFALSSYGKQVLADTVETPYDPLGFVGRVKADAPHLESATIDFVKEAVDCYLGRHFRASAVMLGLASENEILQVIELYKNTLDTSARDAFDGKIKRTGHLKEKFDYLYARLSQDKKALPAQIQELDTWLAGVFQVIRMYRNDAGHPAGPAPSREAVYANLNLFLAYARHLSTLKEWLNSKRSSSP